MDLTGLAIGVLLVFTGVYFIGYPIGKIVGRRQAQREFKEWEPVSVIYGQPKVARERLFTSPPDEPEDVLEAEFVE